MRPVTLLLSLCVLAVTVHPANARLADGTLGTIIIPNNGFPALLQANDTLTVTATKEAALSLQQGETQHSLQLEWIPLRDGSFQGQAVLPDTLPPGAYSLVAQQGEHTDTNHRAVYIFEDFPERYTVAHLTDVHIGKDRGTPGYSDDTFRKTIAAVNASDATFAVLTGDITEGGKEDEFQRFLAILDECRVPTIVVAGNHDRYVLNYEKNFGPLTYTVHFGNDGYLVFDSKDLRIAHDLNPQNTLLELYRRQLMPCRWAIGLTHRYDYTMGMRCQIAVFIDNPLDYVIYGHYHRENKESVLPWGTTKRIATPAAIDGYYRMIEITPHKVLAKPSENVLK